MPTFAYKGVSRGQHNGFTRPLISVFWIGAATFYSSNSSIDLTRLSGPRSRLLLLRKSGSAGNRTRDLCICSQKLWPLDHRGGPRIWIARQNPLLFLITASRRILQIFLKLFNTSLGALHRLLIFHMLPASLCCTFVNALNVLYFPWLDSRRGPRSPHYWGFEITLRHATFCRTPLEEWSARRRNLHLTTALTRDWLPWPRRDSKPQSQHVMVLQI